MATRKIYPVGIDNDTLVFYNAEPLDSAGVAPTADGYVAHAGDSALRPVSLLALLSRPHDFKPFDDSPLAQLVMNPSRADMKEWSELLVNRDPATIAKHAEAAPTAIKPPADYSPQLIAALQSAGVAVKISRQVVKTQPPLGPLEEL